MFGLPIFNLLKIRLFIWVFGAFALLFTGILGGCKKNKKIATLEPEELNSPTQQAIYKSVWLDANTGFICGGKKDQDGFIYKTTNAGSSWQLIHHVKGKCIYDIKFVNDTIAYCCGDDLLLMRSSDNGNTWTDVDFTGVTLESFNHTPLRHIFGNYNLLMCVGGENYHNGNALWFQNDDMRWVWHFDHEFRTGLDLAKDNFVLAGYGNTHRTTDQGYNYSPMEFANDFFTGSSTINSQTAFMCGYDGGIYRTDDGANTWKILLEPNKAVNKRIHFNGMCFKDANTGWVVGTKGLVMSSHDGQTFKEYARMSDADLLSVSFDKLDRAVISSSNGKLFRVNN